MFTSEIDIILLAADQNKNAVSRPAALIYQK